MNRLAIALALSGLLVGAAGRLRGQDRGPSTKPPPTAIIITNELSVGTPPKPATAPPAGGDRRPNTGPGPTVPYLSPGLADIVKLFQAGVEQPVILSFIQSSTVAYHPSAKEVIYLRDIGVPSELITALLRRGGELRDRAAELLREERNRATPAPESTPAPNP